MFTNEDVYQLWMTYRKARMGNHIEKRWDLHLRTFYHFISITYFSCVMMGKQNQVLRRWRYIGRNLISNPRFMDSMESMNIEEGE